MLETKIPFIKEDLLSASAVTLAKEVEQFSIGETCALFYLVGAQKSSEIFSYLDIELQEQLVLALHEKFLHDLIEHAYTDDIRDLLEETTDEIKQKIIQNASALKKRQFKVQAKYSENSAGAIMSMDFVEISDDDNAYTAMNKIKSQEKLAEIITYCYVTNEQHHLVGTISMREILLAPEKASIKEIMNIDIISVDVEDDQEYVANQISKYDLEAIPVVDNQHHILGIITIDDVLDIIEQETTEDIQKMGGISPTEGSYLEMPILSIVKSRIMWLLVLMISATVSGTIINANESITLKLPHLLIFMPMLMDTAGNAGSQSSAMVIRGIVVDDLSMKQFLKVLKKELLNSLVLGFILFTVNILRIIIFMRDIDLGVGILVSITVWCIVLIANLIGGLLPLVASHFKIDPAGMSGPVLTTVCDAISLTIYFALATMYLGGVF